MRGARGLNARARSRWRRAAWATAAVCLISGMLMSAGGAGPAAAATIPSPIAGGWKLNGAAQLVTTATPPNLRLTPATNSKVGSAFWPTAVPGVGITATFDAYLGGGTGADGLTFTLANASVTAPTALGAIGGGEGFAGINGIAVSVDTKKTNASDPSNNFVGIATTSPRAQSLHYVVTNKTVAALRNKKHHFVVTTSATGLAVKMDGANVLSYATSLPASVLVGFTGATGATNDVHRVQSVSITTAAAPPPVPTVTAVSPTSGPEAGGTSVSITGTGLTGASAVKFGATAASTFTVNSATSITATAPAGSGTVDVKVTTPGGTSTANANDHFTYNAAPPPTPTVTGVSPTSGPEAGGTSVSITGTGLTGASAVKFGATAASTFAVNSATSITVTAPAGSGTVDVKVTTPGGTSTANANDHFTYNAPPPPSVPSPVAGGWTLNGSAQLMTSASPPNLQVTPATNWVAGSAFWPTPVPGAGVTAAFDAFIGPGAGADGLTFTLADASATNPTALGNNGGGEGFAGITGLAVSLDTWQNGSDPSNNFVGIATTSPAAQSLHYVATNSTIGSLVDAVHHFVVTTSASGVTVSMDGTQVLNYTTSLPPYVLLGFTSATGGFNDVHQVQNVNITTGAPLAVPTVTAVSPSSGTTAGGTSVTITGTNLTGANAVSFAGVPASTFSDDSDTSITATSPPGAAGAVDVTVTTPNGTSATTANDKFTYVTGPPLPPTISYVDPFSGPVGSLVSIGGDSFTGATAVKFDATPATFTVNNDQSITATAPNGTGTVDVTVTTPSGTSEISDDDHFTFTAGPPPGSVPSPVAGGWQLNGSASLVTGASPPNLQLTPATNWLAGSAFYPIPVPGTGITAAFDAFIGPTAGADGLTFTLADASVMSPTALGSNGGGEGFAGITGLALSLDHWKNDADPSNNFVGLATTTPSQQSMHYVTTNSSIPSLINSVHHFVVTTSTAGIVVNMDGAQVLNDSTTFLPPYVLVGFTGATGGFNDVHQIQNVTITAGPPPPVPTITAVSPNSGPSTGGTTVTITGTGLTSTSSVKFGGTAATDFLVQNDTKVTATAPAGSLGNVDVRLKTAGGTTAISAADKFTYVTPPVPTVTGVSPSSGPSPGGTAVTLTGTGFTGASAVNFGSGNPAVFFTVNSPTSIAVTAPPSGTFGPVDVTVTTPGGTSLNNAADKFTYTVPPTPTVTGVSPASGPNGTFVTITGTNFFGATDVKFGATSADTFTVSNATTIFATSPAASGVVDVTVTTPGGTSVTNAHDSYTYTVPNAPTITSVSPSSGFNTTSVVITGTNYTGASAVSFGATPAASFTVNSDTSITAIAPAGSSTVDVKVTNAGGVSVVVSADHFTYSTGTPPPVQVPGATYRADLGRSGYYPNETGVTQANASTLKLKWTAVGGVGSFAQPIVANNLVYWGDWIGNARATDLSGHDVWSVNLGQNNDDACSPPTAGVSGTATAAVMANGTKVVYVPGGDDNFYALNALTGAQIWKTNLGTPPADYLWASPVLFNGSIYMGVASFGDCPLVQGTVVQMDANTGAIQHIADMTPDGCVGAGVWPSPIVDPSDGSIFVTTGTPNNCHNPGPNMAPAIVKLRASDLALQSYWNVPISEQQYGDEDFGATPTLFTATINGVPRKLVAAMNKNGLLYAWDRSNLAAGPVWQSTIAEPSGSPRSIVSASWDGTYLYEGGGGAIINGQSCYGNISAVDPATGAFVWRSCQQNFMTGGLTEVPGLLVEGVGAGGDVKFINTANGATVSTFATHSMVQGEITVKDGIVYIPQANGNLIALGQ